jgi:hypothetical protein
LQPVYQRFIDRHGAYEKLARASQKLEFYVPHFAGNDL